MLHRETLSKKEKKERKEGRKEEREGGKEGRKERRKGRKTKDLAIERNRERQRQKGYRESSQGKADLDTACRARTKGLPSHNIPFDVSCLSTLTRGGLRAVMELRGGPGARAIGGSIMGGPGGPGRGGPTRAW
jgi:hypothetical protein